MYEPKCTLDLPEIHGRFPRNIYAITSGNFTTAIQTEDGRVDHDDDSIVLLCHGVDEDDRWKAWIEFQCPSQEGKLDAVADVGERPGDFATIVPREEYYEREGLAIERTTYYTVARAEGFLEASGHCGPWEQIESVVSA